MRRDVENAHSLQVGSCGNPRCTCVHIQFIDHRDQLFAQATVPLDGIPAVIDDLQRVAYYIVNTKAEDRDG